MNAHEEALYASQHLFALRRLLAELTFPPIWAGSTSPPASPPSTRPKISPSWSWAGCPARSSSATAARSSSPVSCLTACAPGSWWPWGCWAHCGQRGHGGERHSRADGGFVGRQRPAAVAGVDAHDQVRGRPPGRAKPAPASTCPPPPPPARWARTWCAYCAWPRRGGGGCRSGWAARPWPRALFFGMRALERISEKSGIPDMAGAVTPLPKAPGPWRGLCASCRSWPSVITVACCATASSPGHPPTCRRASASPPPPPSP